MMHVDKSVIMLGDRCQHSQHQLWKSVCAFTREIIGMSLIVCVFVFVCLLSSHSPSQIIIGDEDILNYGWKFYCLQI